MFSRAYTDKISLRYCFIRLKLFKLLPIFRPCVCVINIGLYTVSQKPDTCDIFKYLQQTWANINNFWYRSRESSINLLLLTLTVLQYVVKQRTSLGLPLATRTDRGWCTIIILMKLKFNVSQKNFSNLMLK